MTADDTGADTSENRAGKALDYWSFVELAHERLALEFPDLDAGANSVALALNRAASEITYDFDSTIHRPRGWTWAGYRLAFVLWLAGPLEAHRAATLTGMSRANVSSLGNALQKKGYLEKAQTAHDGRAVTLLLTESGLREIRAVFAEQNARESQWSSALTDVEQGLLVMLLEKLMANRSIIGAKNRK